jgi:hypothetical protein
MSFREKKLPPALKHAAYSTTSLLPGESRAEFEKLHKDLIVEFRPEGALEKDIVSTMARLLWRKQNLSILRKAELAKERSSSIRSKYVKPSLLGFLDQFKDVNQDEAYEAANETANAEALKELGTDAYQLVEMGAAVTLDRLIQELEVRARLDAQIDGCLKRLLHVRGIKSLSMNGSSVPSQKRLPPSE